MGWFMVAIVGAGAGAAARATWGLMRAYERLAAARDEFDDSLHTHRNESSTPNPSREP